MIPPQHRRRHPPLITWDDIAPVWPRHFRNRRPQRWFVAPVSGTWADTLTFSLGGTPDPGQINSDTITFSQTWGLTDYYVVLTDKILFGQSLRIDSSDLANGRYRY